MSLGDIGQRIKGKKTLPIDISYPLGIVDNNSNQGFIINGANASCVTGSAYGGGMACSNIAIGYNSTAEISTTDNEGSIAIGSNANATRAGAIHIGNGNNQNYKSNQIYGAKGVNAVSIGQYSRATSSNTCSMGYSSNASATYAVAIGPGCAASGLNSIALGTYAAAGGTSAIAIGYGSAIGCSANQNCSLAIGPASNTDFIGEFTYGTGAFSIAGDAKISFAVLHFQTTNATQAKIGIGAGATTTQPSANLLLLNDSTNMFDVDIVARNTATDTESKVWNLKFGARRGTSAANTFLIGTPTKTVYGEDTGTSSWDVTALADTSFGGVAVMVTGEAGKTIRWVGNVRMTKVTG